MSSNNSNSSNNSGGNKYSFDESGVTFAVFIATLVGVFIFPKTYFLLFGGKRPAKKGTTSSKKEATVMLKDVSDDDQKKHIQSSAPVQCTCDACIEWRLKNQKLGQGKKAASTLVSHILLAVGWIVFALAVARIMSYKPENTMYDPYSVLGISSSTDDATVRKIYKKLALKLHPDKIAKDATADKKEAEKRFGEISKAYQTLTDPEMKRRWLEEGDPEGSKTFKLGIALPLWMVSGKSSILVVLLYVALFLIGVPVLVSKVWNRSKSYTKDQILHETMQMFYKELKESMNPKKILEFIALADEFKRDLKPVQMDFIESLIKTVNEYCQANSIEHYEVPKKLTDNLQAIKAHLLLFAHTHRIPLNLKDDDDLLLQQRFIVEKAIPLSLGALQISIARKWLPLAQNCMHVCQCIVNAVPSETSNPLLMLPFMDNNLIRHCKTSKRHIKSIVDFLEMGDESRKSLLRSLSEEQQDLMVLMAKQVPKVEILGVKFQVLGQPEVTPEGFVCAQVKLRLTNHANIVSGDSQKENLSTKPEVEEETIDSDEGMEFDEDGNLVEIGKKSKILVDKRANPNDPVHAPYYPVEKRPFWWVILCNRVGTSFVTIPLKVSDLAMHSVKTVTLQFEAPPKAGMVPLKIVVRGDSLLGADVETDCELKVVPDARKEKLTWDISGEEDNDQNGSQDSD